MKDDKLKNYLHTDPLQELENATGERYDQLPPELVLSYLLNHSSRKKEVLRSKRDSYHGMPLDQYEDLLVEIGFQFIHNWPCAMRSFQDCAKIWFHPLGIVLVYDTYEQKSLNSGTFYYVLKFKNGADHSVTSSGGFQEHDGKLLWFGYHDSREAIRYHIDKLHESAEFVWPWPESQRIWLTSYGDCTREGDGSDVWERIARNDSLTKERVADLPQWLQNCITLKD